MGYPTQARMAAGTLFQVGDTSSNAAVNEVQTVNVPAALTGGTVTLKLGPYTTVGIAPAATLATVQAAIQALPNVGAGNCLVTGTPQVNPGTPGVWTCTFVGALAGMPVSLMVPNNNALLPLGTLVTVTMTTPGVMAGPVYTTVAEVTTMPFPAPKRTAKDVTTFDSQNFYREFIADWKDAGDVRFDANFIMDITQDYTTGILSKFEAGTTLKLRIVIPNMISLYFSGFFTEVAITGAKPSDPLLLNGTLKVTGAVSYAMTAP